MEPEGSLLCSQDPTPVSILSHMSPIHTPKPYTEDLFLYYCIIYA
jgi:hypothetical protein